MHTLLVEIEKTPCILSVRVVYIHLYRAAAPSPGQEGKSYLQSLLHPTPPPK